jgi:S-formylglutathione hydrolase FrmB
MESLQKLANELNAKAQQLKVQQQAPGLLPMGGGGAMNPANVMAFRQAMQVRSAHASSVHSGR